MLEKLPIELGNALKHQRAGLEETVYHRLLASRSVATIEVTSLAFANHESIPTRCTADGPGVSPALAWTHIPDDTHSIVLLVEDGDSPTPHPLVHAIAINMDPTLRSLPEGALNAGDDERPAAVDLGLNSLLMHGWLPPDPPPGHGKHHYAFQIFALGAGAALPNSAGRHQVFEAISERVLAAGCLLGTYERPRPIDSDDAAADVIEVQAGAALTPLAV